MVFPPPGNGTPRAPLLSIDLETMVRALRHAEVLAFGTVAASQIRRRTDIYEEEVVTRKRRLLRRD